MTDRLAIEEMGLNSGTGVSWGKFGNRLGLGPRGGVRYARNSGCLVMVGRASLARSSIGVNLFSKRVCSAVAWLGASNDPLPLSNWWQISISDSDCFRSFPAVFLWLNMGPL